MKKTERFTEKEWEEIASLLSDEKAGESDILNQFMADDIHNTGKQWKALNNMNVEKEINIDKAWNSVNSRLSENVLSADNSNTRISFLRTILLRAAAVALILISLGTTVVYMYTNDYFSKKIIASTGNDQKNLLIELPDGSKIVLNRNSEFTYHKNFGKHGRNVKLAGEAFFEISPDVTKPFIISAGKASVKVVGTSFNVITKNDKSEVEVFVQTGKVMLSDNSGSQSIFLDPGYIGTMNSELPEKRINSNPNYMSWNTGHLVYTNEKLEVVFKDLKRVYNLDIIADDPLTLENLWHSPIDDNLSQEDIIRMICLSFNLGYIKDGNVYHLSKK